MDTPARFGSLSAWCPPPLRWRRSWRGRATRRRRGTRPRRQRCRRSRRAARGRGTARACSAGGGWAPAATPAAGAAALRSERLGCHHVDAAGLVHGQVRHERGHQLRRQLQVQQRSAVTAGRSRRRPSRAACCAAQQQCLAQSSGGGSLAISTTRLLRLSAALRCWGGCWMRLPGGCAARLSWVTGAHTHTWREPRAVVHAVHHVARRRHRLGQRELVDVPLAVRVQTNTGVRCVPACGGVRLGCLSCQAATQPGASESENQASGHMRTQAS
jgi:hypothetical protein